MKKTLKVTGRLEHPIVRADWIAGVDHELHENDDSDSDDSDYSSDEESDDKDSDTESEDELEDDSNNTGVDDGDSNPLSSSVKIEDTSDRPKRSKTARAKPDIYTYETTNNQTSQQAPKRMCRQQRRRILRLLKKHPSIQRAVHPD